jgi:DNA-directed RNA polymerase specialized sigma24 family protein
MHGTPTESERHSPANGVQEAIRQVKYLEDVLLWLCESGHLKEVILARFCLGGVRLKNAVATTIGVDIEAMCGQSLKSQHIRVTDNDYVFEKLPALAAVWTEYCVSLKHASKGHRTLTSSTCVAFPSRKKGLAITPRSAERALALALKSSPFDRQLTYRRIQAIGRLLRQHERSLRQAHDERIEEKERQAKVGAERLERIRRKIRPYFATRLADPAAIEDAVQETLVRLNAKTEQMAPRTYEDDLSLSLGIAGNVVQEFRRRQEKEHVSNMNGFFWDATTKEDLGLENSRSPQDSKYVADAMAELVKILNERQLYVISSIYSASPKSASQIARNLRITARSVQRIKAGALKKLQKEILKGTVVNAEALLELLH